ncbi:MAG: hypothetical protein ACTSRU_16430 [Candidatus Hodarchaeales archaeon]
MDLLELADFLKDKAVEHFSDQIGIIVVYGSCAVNNMTDYSDLDMYIIVDDQASIDLSWSFVYKNTAVDAWTMDWKTAEKIASGLSPGNPWSVASALFCNSKIIYSRSESDRVRFEELKQLTHVSVDAHVKSVISNFNTIHGLVELIQLAKKNSDLPSARWAAWNIINSTVDHISRLNGTPLTKNWGSNIAQVSKFPLLPVDFLKAITILCTSPDHDELIGTSQELIENTRELIRAVSKRTKGKPRSEIASTFEETYTGMKEYQNKILSACASKDILLASYAATELQLWIAEEMVFTGAKIPADGNESYLINPFCELKDEYARMGFPELSTFITNADFSGLEKAVRKIDEIIKNICQTKGIVLPLAENREEIEKYISSKMKSS